MSTFMFWALHVDNHNSSIWDIASFPLLWSSQHSYTFPSPLFKMKYWRGLERPCDLNFLDEDSEIREAE